MRLKGALFGSVLAAIAYGWQQNARWHDRWVGDVPEHDHRHAGGVIIPMTLRYVFKVDPATVEAYERRPDRHHASARNFIPHAERKTLQLPHIFARFSDRSIELRHRLTNVGRQLRQSSG